MRPTKDPNHDPSALVASDYWREALLVEELTDEDIAAIAAADVPAEHRYELSDIKD